MAASRIQGIFVPNMIPFDKDGKVNESELRRYINWLIEQGAHGLAIELAIGLGARSANGRPLRPIQHAKLNAAQIRGAAHHAVQGVHFADQMSLADAADRRVHDISPILSAARVSRGSISKHARTRVDARNL